jgi:hypothetical protein
MKVMLEELTMGMAQQRARCPMSAQTLVKLAALVGMVGAVDKC